MTPITDLRDGFCGWYRAKPGDLYRSATQPYRWLPVQPGKFYFTVGTTITHVTLLPCDSPRIRFIFSTTRDYQDVGLDPTGKAVWVDHGQRPWSNVFCENPTVSGLGATTPPPVPIQVYHYKAEEMTPFALFADHDWFARHEGEVQ